MDRQNSDYFSVNVSDAVWGHDPEIDSSRIVTWSRFGLMSFCPMAGMTFGGISPGDPDDVCFALLISRMLREFKDRLDEEATADCEMIVVATSYQAEFHDGHPNHTGDLFYQSWDTGWASVRCGDVELARKQLCMDDNSSYEILRCREFIRMNLAALRD